MLTSKLPKAFQRFRKPSRSLPYLSKTPVASKTFQSIHWTKALQSLTEVAKASKNLYKALKDALFLHITAPTKEQSDEALHLADIFSENLTEEDILKAKSEVDAKVDALSKENNNIDKSIKIDHYLTPGWDEELNNLEIFDLED